MARVGSSETARDLERLGSIVEIKGAANLPDADALRALVAATTPGERPDRKMVADTVAAIVGQYPMKGEPSDVFVRALAALLAEYPARVVKEAAVWLPRAVQFLSIFEVRKWLDRTMTRLEIIRWRAQTALAEVERRAGDAVTERAETAEDRRKAVEALLVRYRPPAPPEPSERS